MTTFPLESQCKVTIKIVFDTASNSEPKMFLQGCIAGLWYSTAQWAAEIGTFSGCVRYVEWDTSGLTGSICEELVIKNICRKCTDYIADCYQPRVNIKKSKLSIIKKYLCHKIWLSLLFLLPSKKKPYIVLSLKICQWTTIRNTVHTESIKLTLELREFNLYICQP